MEISSLAITTEDLWRGNWISKTEPGKLYLADKKSHPLYVSMVRGQYPDIGYGDPEWPRWEIVWRKGDPIKGSVEEMLIHSFPELWAIARIKLPNRVVWFGLFPKPYAQGAVYWKEPQAVG